MTPPPDSLMSYVKKVTVDHLLYDCISRKETEKVNLQKVDEQLLVPRIVMVGQFGKFTKIHLITG